MATTVASPAPRPPGPRSCCPAGRTRSSTSRPRRASRWSAGSGATRTPGSRRPPSSSSARRRTRSVPAPCRTGPTTSARTPRRRTSTTRGGQRLAPADTMSRLSTGRVCFNWYRIAVTLPERIGDTAVAGSTVVFEVVIDDYAEIWVNGSMPHALGDTGGPVVAGLQCAEPGRSHPRRAAGRPLRDRCIRHQWADLGRAGELHLDAHCDAGHLTRRAHARVARARGRGDRLRVHRGPGVVGGRRVALLLPEHQLDLPARSRAREGDAVPLRRAVTPASDIGRYVQPGSNGLTFDPDGRLVMCQHGNRRILRVNPHGDTTVLADSLRGPPAEQPERPGLPLRRQRLVHRPAVRAAGHGR